MASDAADQVSIAAGGDTVSLRDAAMLVPGGAGHLILPGPEPVPGIAAAGGNTSLHGGDFGLALGLPSDGAAEAGALSAAAGLVFAHGSIGAADLIPLAATAPEAAGAPPLPAPVAVGGHSTMLMLADNTQLLFTTLGTHSGT